MIHVAATCGQNQVLDVLSHYFGLIQDQWYSVVKFYNAAKVGNVALIERLLDKGVQPDSTNIWGEHLFWIAAKYGRTAVVDALAQRTDVNVNSMSVSGRSPLFWPSEFGHERVVAILVNAGVNLNLIDKNGDTAVSVARKMGHQRIIDIFQRWKTTE
jgi:ankyrin repeat protein